MLSVDDAVMRPLMVLLGASGLIAGLGCAVVVQTLPEFLVGEYYWTAFAPPGLLQRGGHISLSLPLFPSVVVLPVLGLIVGLVVGFLLARLGWRLTKVV